MSKQNKKNKKNKKNKEKQEKQEKQEKISFVLNRLCNNKLSINGIIELVNQLNAKQMPLVKKSLVSLNLYELLSIKANIEKVDKVNFLNDQIIIKIKGYSFILNSIVKNTLIFMIATISPFLIFLFNRFIFSPDFSVHYSEIKPASWLSLSEFFLINPYLFPIYLILVFAPILFNVVLLSLLLLILFVFLLLIFGVYTFKEAKLNDKETSNHYKILLYLIDIEIDKKKKQ